MHICIIHTPNFDGRTVEKCYFICITRSLTSLQFGPGTFFGLNLFPVQHLHCCFCLFHINHTSHQPIKQNWCYCLSRVKRDQTVTACMQHFQWQKVKQSNAGAGIYQVPIRFGSTRSKLLMFLYRSWSIHLQPDHFTTNVNVTVNLHSA